MDASKGKEEEQDLYEVLQISRTASKSEIKRAYHKAALANHPDKVPQEERESAEIKFKSISRAYEILSDDNNRALYDQHGMAAFDKANAGFPGGAGPDLDDFLAQMFGQGGSMPGGPTGPRRHPKGRSEVQQYEVTLAELYKGKTTKFSSTKNVICDHCKGSGGKEKAKAKECDSCKGRGMTSRLRPVGPGLVTQETVPCSTCHGKGSFYVDKDKCKKCKGERTVKQKKLLELYIPRGSCEGDRIVLKGEADQTPEDDEPGDIIFTLVEVQHETFARAGPDLQADLNITLAEALTGFDRVVLTHLDGRGIKLHVTQPKGKVLRPGEVLRVRGEGMPIKKSELKGDLYFTVVIKFPEDGWLEDQAAVDAVRAVLPKDEIHAVDEEPEEVDEVAFEEGSMEDFGAGSGDPRGGAEWEDEDGAEGMQCQQQ
ncbi:DnaJ-domain-containing protein [Piedraia hortae CBS 480.64]|uniref:DnaJ-domain-containing protein n=1 Tax=Piedraia hortae CBS 480.64 TaxID=1314780 RepID=A0A6A7BXP8_9PEZI|nr:DnaJ-domain-containing protein [Piedraia hortae CBS 480.64]